MATNNALNVQGPTPLFAAYQNANQSIADGTHTISFNTELYDLTASYDGTNTFTAPISGYYNFNFNGYWAQVAAGIVAVRLVTTKNTFDMEYHNGALGDQVFASSTIPCLMDATDTAYIQFYNNTGSDLSILSQNKTPLFSGSLIFAV